MSTPNDSGSNRYTLPGHASRTNQLTYVSLIDGKDNTSVGLDTPMSRGSNTTAVGAYAGSAMAPSSSDVVLLGSRAGQALRNSTNTVAIGSKAAQLANNVHRTVLIGTEAGQRLQNAHFCTLVGHEAGSRMITGVRNTCVGARSGANAFNCHDNTFVGDSSGVSCWNVQTTVCVGSSCGAQLRSGEQNTMVGWAAGANIDVAMENTLVGSRAGYSIQGNTNVVVGADAAGMARGDRNTMVGSNACTEYVGNNNVVIGADAAKYSSFDDTVITGAGIALTGSGSKNVVVGTNTAITLLGNRNTVVGTDVSPSMTGNNNVVIGSNLLSDTPVGNSIVIGTDILASSSLTTLTDSVIIGRGVTIGTRDSQCLVLSAPGVGDVVRASGTNITFGSAMQVAKVPFELLPPRNRSVARFYTDVYTPFLYTTSEMYRLDIYTPSNAFYGPVNDPLYSGVILATRPEDAARLLDLGDGSEYYRTRVWRPLDLSFPVYIQGKAYTRVYVHPQGMMSFWSEGMPVPTPLNPPSTSGDTIVTTETFEASGPVLYFKPGCFEFRVVWVFDGIDTSAPYEDFDINYGDHLHFTDPDITDTFVEHVTQTIVGDTIVIRCEVGIPEDFSLRVHVAEITLFTRNTSSMIRVSLSQNWPAEADDTTFVTLAGEDGSTLVQADMGTNNVVYLLPTGVVPPVQLWKSHALPFALLDSAQFNRANVYTNVYAAYLYATYEPQPPFDETDYSPNDGFYGPMNIPLSSNNIRPEDEARLIDFGNGDAAKMFWKPHDLGFPVYIQGKAYTRVYMHPHGMMTFWSAGMPEPVPLVTAPYRGAQASGPVLSFKPGYFEFGRTWGFNGVDPTPSIDHLHWSHTNIRLAFVDSATQTITGDNIVLRYEVSSPGSWPTYVAEITLFTRVNSTMFRVSLSRNWPPQYVNSLYVTLAGEDGSTLVQGGPMGMNNVVYFLPTGVVPPSGQRDTSALTWWLPPSYWITHPLVSPLEMWGKTFTQVRMMSNGPLLVLDGPQSSVTLKLGFATSYYAYAQVFSQALDQTTVLRLEYRTPSSTLYAVELRIEPALMRVSYPSFVSNAPLSAPYEISFDGVTHPLPRVAMNTFEITSKIPEYQFSGTYTSLSPDGLTVDEPGALRGSGLFTNVAVRGLLSSTKANIKTGFDGGPRISQAGWDAPSSTHTISWQSLANGCETASGILYVHASSKSNNDMNGVITASIVKSEGQNIIVSATSTAKSQGLSTFSLTSQLSNLVVSTNSGCAVCWTFISAV